MQSFTLTKTILMAIAVIVLASFGQASPNAPKAPAEPATPVNITSALAPMTQEEQAEANLQGSGTAAFKLKATDKIYYFREAEIHTSIRPTYTLQEAGGMPIAGLQLAPGPEDLEIDTLTVLATEGHREDIAKAMVQFAIQYANGEPKLANGEAKPVMIRGASLGEAPNIEKASVAAMGFDEQPVEDELAKLVQPQLLLTGENLSKWHDVIAEVAIAGRDFGANGVADGKVDPIRQGSSDVDDGSDSGNDDGDEVPFMP